VRGAYRHSTRVFGAATCALGAAMIVATLVRGGGPLALGVVVGAGFLVIGVGRLYLASQQ
jgi:uncharacterized membrane protein YccC